MFGIEKKNLHIVSFSKGPVACGKLCQGSVGSSACLCECVCVCAVGVRVITLPAAHKTQKQTQSVYTRGHS